MQMKITNKCKEVLNQMRDSYTSELEALYPALKESKDKGDLSENAEYTLLKEQVDALSVKLEVVELMLVQPTASASGNVVREGKVIRITEVTDYEDEPSLTQGDIQYSVQDSLYFNRDLLVSEITIALDCRDMLLNHNVISPHARIISSVMGKPPGEYEVRVNPQLTRKLRYEIVG